MKKLTLNDATKEELIQYFFQPEGFGGGFRVNAPVDRFLLWLQRKRAGELQSVWEEETDNSLKAFHEYVDFVHQANEEKDLDKKLKLFAKANEAYERYEKADKRANKLDGKIQSIYGF